MAKDSRGFFIRTSESFSDSQNDILGVNHIYGQQSVFNEEKITDPGQYIGKCNGIFLGFENFFIEWLCGSPINKYRNVESDQIIVRGIEMLVIEGTDL
jgi:hypothetical protein